MAGILSFTYRDAAELPLTAETVGFVRRHTLWVLLRQVGVTLVIVVGIERVANALTGPGADLLQAIAMFVMLAVMAMLIGVVGIAVARLRLRRDANSYAWQGESPEAFWSAHRKAFPLSLRF